MINRLTAARTAVEEVCRCLLSPSPAMLERCGAALATAAAELTCCPSWTGPERSNSEALAEAQRLRRAIRRAHKLLEAAHRFHNGWHRIRSVMTDGYQPEGPSPLTAPRGRISLRG